MDLFSLANDQPMKSEAPLADRLRPRILDEYVGQSPASWCAHPRLGKLLRRAIEADRLFASLSRQRQINPISD